MDSQTEISNSELFVALTQQKHEQCAIFCARLNKMASMIRRNDLTPIEIADLLDQESELIQRQHEDHNL